MILRLLTICLFILLFAGCASEPVRTELSGNHPANPEAPETAFVPPPDPFRGVEIPVPQKPPPSEETPAHHHGEQR
jgi:hypothetical protein